jgi:hypothetical protein
MLIKYKAELAKNNYDKAVTTINATIKDSIPQDYFPCL